MGLSPFENCIRDICPFAPIFQGNNCFRLKYLEITLTFYICLETSWIEATDAMGSMGLSTGWWKYVFQIFETSWMLCGSVALVNENIWELFAPRIGRPWKWLFWSLLKRKVWLASTQNFNFHSHSVRVFCWRTATFFTNIWGKYFSLNLWPIFQLSQTDL